MDVSALELDLGLFEADVFGERAPSHGDENFLSGNGLRLSSLVLECNSGALSIFFHRFDFGFGFDVDALFLECFLKLRRNFLVLEGNDARQSFEQRHFGAEGAIDRGKFDAHGAATDDHERLGDGLQLQNFAIGQDGVAVNFHAGKGSGFRAGGNHRVGSFNLGGFAVFFDGNSPRAGDASPASDGINFVFLEEHADSARMFLDDFVLAGQHGRPIDFDVFCFKPKFLGALKVVVNICVVQKYLGGNAAYMQAGTAEKRILLDYGCLEPPLACTNRGDITAGAAPDDHEIIFGQASSPLFYN